MFESLVSELKPLGLEVIKPVITKSNAASDQSTEQQDDSAPPLQVVK